MRHPLAYFITFSTYASNLPGRSEFWVDGRHNRYGAEFAPEKPALFVYAASHLSERPFTLDAEARALCASSISDYCKKKNVTLVALHVRTTHVHAIAGTNLADYRLLNGMKAACSRTLNRVCGVRKKRWARGGSKRKIWAPSELNAAVEYVLDRQGDSMERLFDEEAFWRMMSV